jgi:type I restriction enzyme S subunit
MKGWKKVTLGQIAPYSTPKIDAGELNAHNFISADNMEVDRGGITASVYAPSKGRATLFEEEDVLVSNIRPYFKKIWQAKFRGGCSNDVFVLRAKKNLVDPMFLYYNLSKQDFFDYMMAGANGTKMPRGNKKAIPNYKINLPPLPTQRKIASILSAYDDLIENNLKRIKLLEEKAQLTYEEWFVRMKFPGHESTPINKETGLPEGWEKKKIVNFNSISQYKKKVTKFEGEIEYLATANVDRIAITERGEMVNWDNKPSRAQILPPRESIWFARMSNTFKVLHFTKKTNNNVLLSSGFVGFIPKNSDCLAFLFCMIKSEKFDLQKNMYASGSTQVSLNNQGLSLMNEIEPSLELIEKFGEIHLNKLELIHVLYNQNQLLKEARDILLPRLMTGMINVEQINVQTLKPTTA